MPPGAVRIMGGAVERLFEENGHEHGRDVLEAVFALDAGEQLCVTAEFVGHLVDDESGFGTGSEGLVDALDQQPFLVDLHRRERDTGDDVIAILNPQGRQFLRQIGRVGI